MAGAVILLLLCPRWLQQTVQQTPATPGREPRQHWEHLYRCGRVLPDQQGELRTFPGPTSRKAKKKVVTQDSMGKCTGIC